MEFFAKPEIHGLALTAIAILLWVCAHCLETIRADVAILRSIEQRRFGDEMQLRSNALVAEAAAHDARMARNQGQAGPVPEQP